MKKDFERFEDLFLKILQIKDFVIKLKGKELRNFKLIFYNQKFSQWRLDMLWEFIWDDIDFEKLIEVFKNSRII